MRLVWEKLADCPLHTEYCGDAGYVYAVTIFENEVDTPCRTKDEAKKVVEEALAESGVAP